MRHTENGSPGEIDIAKANGIGRITFDNPTRRNALTLKMWRQLGEAAHDLNNDPEVRVIVLQGKGTKAFASGADVTEFEKYRSNADQKEAYGQISGGAQRALRNIDKPVVAMIRGYCIGGGLVLAMAADVRFANFQSKFGVPAAKLGLGYDFANTAALARLVGPSAAKDILFSARHVGAEEAMRLGLVNAVVEDDQIEAAVDAYARSIAENAPLTTLTTKAAIRAYETYSEVSGAGLIAEMVDRCFDSEDYREGWKSFLEKRPPQFRGR